MLKVVRWDGVICCACTVMPSYCCHHYFWSHCYHSDLDTTVAFVTVVAFIIPSVVLMSSLVMMSSKLMSICTRAVSREWLHRFLWNSIWKLCHWILLETHNFLYPSDDIIVTDALLYTSNKSRMTGRVFLVWMLCHWCLV